MKSGGKRERLAYAKTLAGKRVLDVERAHCFGAATIDDVELSN